ncbi:MAG: hypothetical protein ACR2JK_09085 [Geodermatophilaceae bacterium]
MSPASASGWVSASWNSPSACSRCSRRRAAQAVDYVTSAGELEPGAHGVAAPVRGVPRLEASVGVVALTALDSRVIGSAVVDVAAALC